MLRGFLNSNRSELRWQALSYNLQYNGKYIHHSLLEGVAHNWATRNKIFRAGSTVNNVEQEITLFRSAKTRTKITFDHVNISWMKMECLDSLFLAGYDITAIVDQNEQLFLWFVCCTVVDYLPSTNFWQCCLSRNGQFFEMYK